MRRPAFRGNDLHLEAEIPHARDLAGIGPVVGYQFVHRGQFADFAEGGRAELGRIREKDDPARGGDHGPLHSRGLERGLGHGPAADRMSPDEGDIDSQVAEQAFAGLAKDGQRFIVNRSGFLPEAILFESRGHGFVVQHGEVAFLCFGRRDEADGLQKPAIVKPVHPVEDRELDGLEVAPWASSMDDLAL